MLSVVPRRASAHWPAWLGITAATTTAAYVLRWVRLALEDRPRVKRPSPPAACVPAAAREQQRLADTTIWRRLDDAVARRALASFRVRPTLRRLRILHLDHGPGGVSVALAQRAPQDSLVVALDPLAGMGDLASHRAARRGHRAPLAFLQGWSFALPIQDRAADLVVSTLALHQWPNPEAVLHEIARVLSPDGRYLVLDLRRDLPPWLWLLVRFVQAILVPRDLRTIGEPGASIGAAFAPPEAEWLAARAKLPDLRVVTSPAWLTIERTETADERG